MNSTGMIYYDGIYLTVSPSLRVDVSLVIMVELPLHDDISNSHQASATQGFVGLVGKAIPSTMALCTWTFFLGAN